MQSASSAFYAFSVFSANGATSGFPVHHRFLVLQTLNRLYEPHHLHHLLSHPLGVATGNLIQFPHFYHLPAPDPVHVVDHHVVPEAPEAPEVPSHFRQDSESGRHHASGTPRWPPFVHPVI